MATSFGLAIAPSRSECGKPMHCIELGGVRLGNGVHQIDHLPSLVY